MSQKLRVVSSSLLVASLVALGMGAGHAMAATPTQAGGTVIASGLANPRGLTVGDDGSVYVAESGTGGDQVIGQGDQQIHWGYSGHVTKIAPDGSASVVVGNLPSSMGGEGASGLSDLAYSGGTLWATIGVVTGGTPHVPGENSLLRIDAATGMTQTVADIGAYEAQHNPAGFAVDSNPYGVTVGPDGMVYVADAAGNTVYKVDPVSGAVNVVAVIPGISLPPGIQAPPGGNPERGGALELDPVPTGVSFGDDGNLYVSLLSGGPFPPGAARVDKVTTDGKVSVAFGGLTTLTDIKRGPDGAWYVVEFAQFGEQGPAPNSGDIVRIAPNGQHAVVVSGLNFPNKIAFDRSGNLYATVGSVTPGGQVLRFSNLTGATPGMPSTGQSAGWPLAIAILGLLLSLVGVVVRRRHGVVPL